MNKFPFKNSKESFIKSENDIKEGGEVERDESNFTAIQIPS